MVGEFAKMKLFFCVLALFVGSCYSASVSNHNLQKIDEHSRKLILQEGYRVRNYTVETEDGYILDLLRISDYRKMLDKDFVSEYTGTEEVENQSQYTKQVVLLMPTMMSTFEEFVAGGQTEGLAFALADVGYDVFMGHTRGSYYGRRHVRLNPDSDDAFWDYSWHEMGVKDLPAIIDKIISVTQESTINYVGHMEGSTIFYVMASEKPEYNNKIRKMVALGPIAILRHSTHELLRILVDDINNIPTEGENSNVWDSNKIKQKIGKNVFTPSRDLIEQVESKCKADGFDEPVCGNIYFLLNGYNSQHYNKTIVNMVPQIPSFVSARQILHYIQNKISGDFSKYDDHFDLSHPNGESYDLSKVTAPVVIFYTGDDVWSQTQCVEALMNKLPNVISSTQVEGRTNNMDLLYSNNVHTVVHNSVIQLLKQVQQRA